MTIAPIKIDSNVTGLSFAEEVSLKTLSGSPIWYPLEPNSYKDFGGDIKMLTRDPISATRQRKRGVITSIEASGSFEQDLTFSNLTRLFQGFFFADAREKFTTIPLNAAVVPITAVDGSAHTYAAAGGLSGLLAGDLLFGAGFANSANNGLQKASVASSGTTITLAAGLTTEASPPAVAALVRVGYELASGTADIVIGTDGLPYISRASGSVDWTTLGLIPAEWIFIGGDLVGQQFSNNGGFARIKAITTSTITLDKTSFVPANEVGTGKTIRIFFGTIIRNESTLSLIKRRSYQLERQLGSDADGVMSEYLTGAIPNEMNMTVKSEDKITIEFSFVGLDMESRAGVTGPKSGTRIVQPIETAFNTSQDVTRINLSAITVGSANPVPLFAFSTDAKLMIKNNAKLDKAIGSISGIDVTVGNFEVDGDLTAYFASQSSIAAIRANADCTIDMLLQKANKALLFDLPLIELADGRLDVKKDEAITLPVTQTAVQSSYGHTLQFQSFYYLPTIAGGV